VLLPRFGGFVLSGSTISQKVRPTDNFLNYIFGRDMAWDTKIDYIFGRIVYHNILYRMPSWLGGSIGHGGPVFFVQLCPVFIVSRLESLDKVLI